MDRWASLPLLELGIFWVFSSFDNGVSPASPSPGNCLLSNNQTNGAPPPGQACFTTHSSGRPGERSPTTRVARLIRLLMPCHLPNCFCSALMAPGWCERGGGGGRGGRGGWVWCGVVWGGGARIWRGLGGGGWQGGGHVRGGTQRRVGVLEKSSAERTALARPVNLWSTFGRPSVDRGSTVGQPPGPPRPCTFVARARRVLQVVALEHDARALGLNDQQVEQGGGQANACSRKAVGGVGCGRVGRGSAGEWRRRRQYRRRRRGRAQQQYKQLLLLLQ